MHIMLKGVSNNGKTKGTQKMDTKYKIVHLTTKKEKSGFFNMSSAIIWALKRYYVLNNDLNWEVVAYHD